MPKALFNHGFFYRSLALLLGVAGLAWGIHWVQMRRHAGGQLARADQAEREGDARELLASLSRYLEFNPGDTPTRARYGMALADQARTSAARWRALQVLNTVLLRDPRQSEARARAAELSLALGNSSDALRYLEPALAAFPRRADWHDLHARIREASGNNLQAAAALERVLDLEPGRIPAAVRLAELLHSRLRQAGQAERVLAEMVRQSADRPAALLARATFRGMHGKPSEAADDLKRAIQEDEKRSELRIAWGRLAADRGELDESAHQWKQATELAPENPETWLGLAWAERERGQLDRSAAALRDGLARHKDQPGMLVALAEVRIAQGKQDEAKLLTARLPADARGAILYLEGLAHVSRKDWLAGVKSLVAAIDSKTLPPSLGSKALLALCRAYSALGGSEERLVAARHAHHLADTLAARLERASAALDVGLVSEALVHLRHLAAQPRKLAGTWLLLARATVEHNASVPPLQRHWIETERALDHAASEPADAVAVLLLRARMLELRGEADAACALLETGLKKHKDSVEVWLKLAGLEARQGREARAATVLARADRHFGDKAEWLLVRADQLARRGTSEAVREMERLRVKASRLPPTERARLEWHLLLLHQRGGRPALVRSIGTSLLARFPAEPRLRLLLAEARLQSGDDTGAKEQVAQLRKQDENGAWWRVVEAERLSRLVRQGDRSHVPAVRKLLAQASKTQPTWSQPALVLARLEDALGRPKEALKGYLATLERGDWSAEPLRRALQLLLAAGRHPEADRIMERAQRRGMLEATLLRSAAFIALRAGRVERARDLARLAVPPGTKSYRDLLWLGRLLDSAGLRAEAESTLQESIALAPDAVDPWLALARVQRNDLRADDAKRTLERMKAALPPRERLAAQARGEEVLGRLRDAEASLRAHLKDEPHDAEVLRRLANLLIRTNQPLAAEKVLTSLLLPDSRALFEERPELRRQLALALTAPEQPRQRTAEALAWLAQTRPRKEADRRAAALVRGRDPARRANTLAELASATDLLPEEKFRLAQLRDAAGEWPAARDILQELASRDPDNPGYVAELVDGLARNGRRTEARTWLAKLEKLDAKHPMLPKLREQLQND